MECLDSPLRQLWLAVVQLIQAKAIVWKEGNLVWEVFSVVIDQEEAIVIKQILLGY